MSDFALQLARRFEPRHLLIALAAVIASFAALDFVYKHALDSLVAFHLDDSDPAVRNSFPAVVIGVMFLSAAGALAFAVASHARHAASRPGGALTAVVSWSSSASRRRSACTPGPTVISDVDWNIAYLPFIAIAAVVVVRDRAPDEGQPRRAGPVRGRPRRAGWWRPCSTRPAPAAPRRSPAASCWRWRPPACCCSACTQYARACSLAGLPGTADPRESILAIARAAVGRVDIRALLIGLALLAVVFGILGAIVYPGGGDLRAFDLNKEQTFPATFSGVLLLAAGGLALLNGLVRLRHRGRSALVDRARAGLRIPRARRDRRAARGGPGPRPRLGPGRPGARSCSSASTPGG